MSGLSLRKALQITATALNEAGISDPRGEARLLLRAVTGYSGTQMIICEDEPLRAQHHAAWQRALRQRQTRRPLAHIEGVAHFYGLTLKSDARALIPRADSEVVIDLALTQLPIDRSAMIADLGTGSGALLSALLSERSLVKGVGVERSPDAADLAAENIQELGLADRAALFQGAWGDWTGWADCDLIISNPPYIVSDIIADLEPEVRAFDPLEALDGGPDGLRAYREIIGLAAAQMKPGAYLVLEIGYDQRREVSDLLSEVGFADLDVRRDLGGHDRALSGRKL